MLWTVVLVFQQFSSSFPIRSLEFPIGSRSFGGSWVPGSWVLLSWFFSHGSQAGQVSCLYASFPLIFCLLKQLIKAHQTGWSILFLHCLAPVSHVLIVVAVLKDQLQPLITTRLPSSILVIQLSVLPLCFSSYSKNFPEYSQVCSPSERSFSFDSLLVPLAFRINHHSPILPACKSTL